MFKTWCKLTYTNGFDETDTNNAKQNSYAWSMGELADYIYVGTGTNMLSLLLDVGAIFADIDKTLFPQLTIHHGEIWRYKKTGTSPWERVYQAPSTLELLGFRDMFTFTDEKGTTRLYACAHHTSGLSSLWSTTDGTDWSPVTTTPFQQTKISTLTMHQEKLYLATYMPTAEAKTALFVSQSPNQQWEPIPLTGITSSTSEIISMASFHQYLYLGIAAIGGFEIWKANLEDTTPIWECVVDKGAGDALNELPLSMAVFKDQLYVGTGIEISIKSRDPKKGVVPPKGFDIITIDANDNWEVLVGSDPIWPTKPTTGTRNKGKYPSGFGNLFNSYCWQIQSYVGELYIGTLDASILWNLLLQKSLTFSSSTLSATIPSFIPDLLLSFMRLVKEQLLAHPDWENFQLKNWLNTLIDSVSLLPVQYGFDFFTSADGELFETITLDGLHHAPNYGISRLFIGDDKSLYVGTANPFEGCQVWKYCNNCQFPCPIAAPISKP